MAQFTPQEIQYQMAHLHDSRRKEVVSSAITMICLTTTAVAFRFAVRKFKKIPLWWDDWLCLISLPFSILGAILSIANQALGHHILSFTVPEVTHYLKILYAGEIQFGVGIVLVKLAILTLYRRVFPFEQVSRTWRICWWVLCVLSTVQFSFTFSGAFQCRPIAFFWDRTIPGGHCIEVLPYLQASGIFNLLLDVFILTLPIPVLSRLQMGILKKIGLIGLFLLGGFVCVTSIIRLAFIHQIEAADFTWAHVDSTIWSFVEPMTALICACLPVLVPPFCAQIVAFATSIYSSYNRSKQSSSGVTTIGQANVKSRQKQKAFGNFTIISKDSSISAPSSSEMEAANPVMPRNEFDQETYEKGDLEKGTQFRL